MSTCTFGLTSITQALENTGACYGALYKIIRVQYCYGKILVSLKKRGEKSGEEQL